MRTSTLAILIILLLIPVIVLIFSARADRQAQPVAASPSPTPIENAAELADPEDVATAKTVVLQTSKGDITLHLYQDESPKTVKNFVTLGKRGYYNNVTFHRISKGFVIQAGDPTGTGSGGESIYGATFPDEINNRKIVKGSLAMANRGANTNSSQFFIVIGNEQPHLDGVHTNFGEVDPASMSVVDAIAAVPTDESESPQEEIKITGFRIIE